MVRNNGLRCWRRSDDGPVLSVGMSSCSSVVLSGCGDEFSGVQWEGSRFVVRQIYWLIREAAPANGPAHRLWPNASGTTVLVHAKSIPAVNPSHGPFAGAASLINQQTCHTTKRLPSLLPCHPLDSPLTFV
jgi:hypothetical protein